MLQVLSRWLPRLALPAILLLTLIVYGQVIGFDFVDWDDPSLIIGNPLIQTFNPAIFWSFEPELYAPLSLLSFQIEHALAGFEPSLFHITNLLLHLINIVLVWKLLTSLGKSQIINHKSHLIFILLGTALFALHPIQAETVAWVSARKELLWTFFGLLALIAYVQPLKDHSQSHPVLRLLMRHRVFLFTLLALLSKPTAVVLPLIMIGMDWQNKTLSKASVQKKWPLLLLAVTFGLLGLLGKSGSTISLSLWDHLLLAATGIPYALQLIFWPSGYALLHPAQEPIALLTMTYGGSLVFLMIAGMLLWKFRNTLPLFTLGIGMFVLMLLPALFAPIHAETITILSEHYLYFPLIGIAIAISGLLAQSQIINHKLPIVPVLLLLILLALLTPLTFFQASVWRDSATLFESVRNTYPRSAPVLTNLGAAYARMERYPEAESILRQAVGLDPDLAQAHFNLGGLRYIRGNYPGAITEYKRVIELNPAHIDAWRMLTWSYYRSGEMVKAREAYDSAIHLRPTLRELLPDLRTTPEVAL
jgi:tetratricopeptide (TPR) repeat protein